MLRGGSAGSSTRDSRSGSLQRMVRRCGHLGIGVEFGNLVDGVDATGGDCRGVVVLVAGCAEGGKDLGGNGCGDDAGNADPDVAGGV